MTTNQLKETDYAWVAAVLEIRASFSTKTHASRRLPQVTMYIDTKQIEIVDRLCKLTGQKVEAHMGRPLTKFDRRNCDIHCPTPHVHVNDYEDNRKERMPTKRWTISGGAIVVVLYNTIDFMTTTGQSKFLEMSKVAGNGLPLVGQGSAAVKTSIRRLALLGCALPEEYMSFMD